MEKCIFCCNMFGNTQMLKQHQKKTKYCLKIQEAKAKNKREEIVQEKDKELTCNFCGKQFKNKYILDSHTKQAKYCLKIQESQNQKIVACLIICKFCGKNFSTASFNRHDSTCKKKNQSLIEENNRLKSAEKDQEIAMLRIIVEKEKEKDQEIAMLRIIAEKEKDQEIAMLRIIAEKEKEQEIGCIYKNIAISAQATIEKIANKPTYQKNTTKNIQNNLMISNLTPLDLSQARVDSIIHEKYTKNDFYEGQKGAAHLVHKYIATDSEGNPQIVCTDTERGIFHHKSSLGDHVVDYKNVHLIKRVHSPLKRKAGAFAAEESVKNPTALKEIINNMTYIKDLEDKPGLFNRTLAQLTGKNCARQQVIDNPEMYVQT